MARTRQPLSSLFPLAIRGSAAAGGGAPTLTETANLSLWLDANVGAYVDSGSTLAADGQTVQQWNDQSGNGYNASQGVANSRPTFATNQLNGYPALNFIIGAPKDDVLKLSGAGLALNRNKPGATLYLVVNLSGTLSSRSPFNIYKTDGTGSRMGAIIGQNAAGSIHQGWRRLDADGFAQQETSGGVVTAGSWFILTWWWDWTNQSWAVYNSSTAVLGPATKGTNGSSQDSDSAGISIGANNTADPPGSCLGGLMAELLFYDVAHDATQRGNVWDYLEGKYAL